MSRQEVEQRAELAGWSIERIKRSRLVDLLLEFPLLPTEPTTTVNPGVPTVTVHPVVPLPPSEPITVEDNVSLEELTRQRLILEQQMLALTQLESRVKKKQLWPDQVDFRTIGRRKDACKQFYEHFHQQRVYYERTVNHIEQMTKLLTEQVTSLDEEETELLQASVVVDRQRISKSCSQLEVFNRELAAIIDRKSGVLRLLTDGYSATGPVTVVIRGKLHKLKLLLTLATTTVNEWRKNMQ